jgi:hypothetical protein
MTVIRKNPLTKSFAFATAKGLLVKASLMPAFDAVISGA